MLHISIAPDILFYIGSLPITNTFLTSTLLVVLFIAFCVFYIFKSHDNNSTFLFFIRFILTKLRDLFLPVLKDKTNTFYPYIAALFLFILLSNWLGLIPGIGSITILSHKEYVPLFKASTADLNTTIGLALLTVLLIQFVGIKYLGVKEYVSKFIAFKSPISFFTGILEIISEFSKIISFAFRLFGNVFAGEVLIAVVAFLVPILASFPFLLLEIFVGFIQAIVFSMLTAVFLNLAIAKHN